MKIFKSFSELIGNTPLYECSSLSEGTGAKIFAKLEYKNPAGSVKDRVALAMLEDAEKRGLIKKGSLIIEPTSGNTGIGIAMVSLAKGYRCIIVMPDSMSPERVRIMRAYGAEVVLTPGALGMRGSIERANEILSENEGAFIPSQFENPENPMAHYRTTGPEIYEALSGKVDIFVAGVGTGGTVSGVGKYLKEKNKNIKIVAVEPSESPVISGGAPSPHKIQGIGAGFIPKTLDTSVIDEVITVSSDEAFATAKLICDREGILVGISSGAAAAAARKLSEREENKGKNIVTLFADSGERYLSH
ncbi:MAG: cysteine synthase A [Clostridia bacterium]|nr:cysteine synthase A [Clostridia bacterium]